MEDYFVKYPGPVLLLDKKSEILVINPATKLFLKKEDARGLLWLDLCPELNKESWKELLSGGPALQIECITNETVYLFTHVYDQARNRIIVCGTNITSWKANEIKIREQQAVITQMARFPDMNPGPVIRMYPDGKIHLSNLATSATFRKDLYQKNWRDLCPQITDAIWNQILSSDQVIPVEIPIAEKWFVFHHRWDRHSGFVFVYGTDITLNKLNEKRLEEQKTALAAMARFPDMNPGPVIRMNVDGVILLSNISAKNVFGKTITGQSWLQVCPDMTVDKWKELIQSEKVYPHEIKVGEKDFVFNHCRDFELNLVFVFGTDVTWQKLTEKQLRHSEKMASLGELTAGIAHEIQNPLNFVNNFSEVNSELIAEMKDELAKGNIEEAKTIANDIDENERKIIFHGKRADAIVKGMLQHSRSSSGVKEPTDINKLADEYLRLAYHGLRAKDKSFNATMKTDFDESTGNINIIPQDIGRVILNLITNAFYVVDQKKKSGVQDYEPTVTIATASIQPPLGARPDDPVGRGRGIQIKVSDNGDGIPQNMLDKIFQPFFTTKPTGQGTGLGLSLSYDIVKAHGGEIKVETREGEGSEFVITLPS